MIASEFIVSMTLEIIHNLKGIRGGEGATIPAKRENSPPGIFKMVPGQHEKWESLHQNDPCYLFRSMHDCREDGFVGGKDSVALAGA